MQTDISIPNPLHHAVEKLATELGISLSELYTVALQAYVYEHAKQSITDALNTVYTNETSTLEPEWIKMQVAAIGAWGLGVRG
jgi:metal-responsive CopG/Arc/MetJ family transcriptional regulator